jgi:hypothetical protein
VVEEVYQVWVEVEEVFQLQQAWELFLLLQEHYLIFYLVLAFLEVKVGLVEKL